MWGVFSGIDSDWIQPLTVSRVVPSGDGLWGVSLFHPGPLPMGLPWPVFAHDDMFISHSCKDHAIIILGWTSFSTDSTRYILLKSFEFQSIVLFCLSGFKSQGQLWALIRNVGCEEHWQGRQHAPVLKTSQDHVGLIIHIKWINFDQSFWPRSESFIRHYFSQIMEVARSWDNKNKRLDVASKCIRNRNG